MSFDLKKHGVKDLTKVTINYYWQLEYWADKFGVIPEILQDAVGYVGPLVKDIREWLYKRGHIKIATGNK
ncbi:MAG: DUF3606 domain-containing protein [Chitinophagaceae bacterium]